MFLQSAARRLVAPYLLLLATVLPSPSRAQINDGWPSTAKILVFYGVAGFHHSSITNGIAMFKQMDSISRTPPRPYATLYADFFDQASLVDSAHLAKYNVVVLLQCTLPGTLFNEAQRKALLGFVERGGGLVAIHGSMDVMGGWDEYDALLGTSYAYHHIPDRRALRTGWGATAKILINGLAGEVGFDEEWNQLRPFPAVAGMDTVNSMSDTGFTGMDPRTGRLPVSWSRNLTAGRVFGTVLGHNPRTYSDCYFIRLMRNAILWTAHQESNIYFDAHSPASPGCPVLTTADNPLPRNHAFGPAGFRAVRGEGVLRVTVQLPGAHLVSVRSLEGKLQASARGTGAVEHEFTNLRSGTVYLVDVRWPGGRMERRLISPGTAAP